MNRIITDTKHPIKIWASELEQEAENQIRNVASLPFIYKAVAVMPDAHAGKGSTVGTVLATRGAIIPSCIGVDIGCGMAAIKLPFKIDMLGNVATLRHSIERSIPLGHNYHKSDTDNRLLSLKELGIMSNTGLEVKPDFTKIGRQLGTLGGGNHFIEICQDQNNDAWLMLHSGSRNVGKILAERHIQYAKDDMKKYFIDLPDPDLAYVVEGSSAFNNYVHDVQWAQKYAAFNREEMVRLVLKDISHHVYKEDKGPEVLSVLKVNCHHNYISRENFSGNNVWVTRKGAVSARTGELGIIPGSMGTKSYIVEGLGNEESFCSCSHGAGRKMSRTKARATFTQEDLAKQTLGVECRKDLDVIDEIPGAYKNIDVIMNDQIDLVKPLYELKALICIKG